MRFPVHFVWLLSVLCGSAAVDPFGEHVRPTDPLEPALQLKSFHLPDGFRMQLVAAEPDLRKPLNMAFDVTGRLWLTESREYPRAAPTNSRPRDTIRVFSDLDEQGRAHGITTFATNLNIPIGIYPFRSASSVAPDETPTWKCIVWSIPNILLLEDTDHNGAADHTQVLYGPFDFTRDTHGNQASFRRGADGWIYATHGFNNRSTVSGTDGDEVELQSGNTYRFRIDGSRIEKWTHGQVNPFGLYFDARGNLYSADCHSSPIYQLLRGACYPSFGKPHDGLGFAPQTIRHSHGSTAIAGIVMVEDPVWPAEFRGNLLVGNVMTSRINRDRVEWRGSSSVGHEIEDLLKCDDPWFRPVDLQFGPDSCLYVADFYNRIIGHYEVPLDHPGRDRERGRIWRIVPPGVKDRSQALPESVPDLIAELAADNPTRRALALNELSDRTDPKISRELKRVVRGKLKSGTSGDRKHLLVNGLWLLQRGGALGEGIHLQALADPDESVRLHATRIAAGMDRWSSVIKAAVVRCLKDEDALVRRNAAEALGIHPASEAVEALLGLLGRTSGEDTHLEHAIRIALRNQLAAGKPELFTRLAALNTGQRVKIADICLAIGGAAAADFVFREGFRTDAKAEQDTRKLKHIAQHLERARLDEFVELLRERAGSADQQLTVLKHVLEGLRERDDQTAAMPQRIIAWGGALAKDLLNPEEIARANWGNTPLPNRRRQGNPWQFQERACEDGKKARLMSSHPLGERLTGRLRSISFQLPDKLSFYLCGHRGLPKVDANDRNRVRLRDAKNGRTLREAFPPRHDTARRIEWDLKEFAGRQAYVEVIDGDSDASYAWLAFGRFSPELPELELRNPRPIAERYLTVFDLAGGLPVEALREPIRQLVAADHFDLPVRSKAAAALANLTGGKLSTALAQVIGNSSLSSLREAAASVLLTGQDPAQFFESTMIAAQAAQQLEIARVLAGTKSGAELLLSLAELGKAAPSALLDLTVATKLASSALPDAPGRIARLTADLPPPDSKLDAFMSSRAKEFRGAKTDIAQGRVLFELACAVCHQVGGKGNIVGPQLDGIGGRGIERLIEDILDPNRNVDVAFRAESLVLKNGDLITGLVRGEEGRSLLLADATGKEVRVPQSDIRSRSASTRSLMPDNFHEAIPAESFNHLLAFLMSLRAK
jgi:putative heme-binding domain-containing protein